MKIPCSLPSIQPIPLFSISILFISISTRSPQIDSIFQLFPPFNHSTFSHYQYLSLIIYHFVLKFESSISSTCPFYAQICSICIFHFIGNFGNYGMMISESLKFHLFFIIFMLQPEFSNLDFRKIETNFVHLWLRYHNDAAIFRIVIFPSFVTSSLLFVSTCSLVPVPLPDLCAYFFVTKEI